MKLAELPVTMSGTTPLIAGSINGADATFIADSGAFFATMSLRRAHEYGLRLGALPFGFRVEGIGGTTSDVQLGVAADFTLTGLLNRTFHNVNFVVLDDASAAFGEGPGAPIALIGQNLLGVYDTEYDLANGYIRLFQPQDCSHGMLAYWHGDQVVQVVKIGHTDLRSPHLIGGATLNGSNIRVLFDTGAHRSILVRKAAARLGFKPDGPDVTAAGLSGGIGRRSVETWIARFDSLDLGGEQIKNVRLRVGDTELPGGADMLLGADFFLSHRVYVANSQHQLYFTYNGGRVFDLSVNAEKEANATAAPGGARQAPEGNGDDGPAADAPPGTPTASATTGSTTTPPADAAARASAPGAGNDYSDAPTDAAAFRRRGAASAGRLRYRAAIADFDQAIRLEPNNAENYLQRAVVHVDENEAAEALSDYDHALRLSPDSIPALLGRAQLRLASSDEAGARADFDQASALAPQDSGLSLHVAEIYLYTGRFEQGITLFDHWIAAHPSDSRLGAARIGRCWARAASGKDLNLALDDCNAAVQRGSNSYALQTRGLVWLRLGNFDKSIADYKASLKLQPRNAFARYGLGLAERGKGMHEQGDQDIQAANAESSSVAARFQGMGLAP
ncbi:MAG TPA: aspartyl protease family protein [Steroidobacteraceae bacterium]|nr:aspartyl protease family protein [Steroidobacteraceae bacterium]